MKIKLIIGLILMGLVAVVALQNAEIVTVKFLLWQFSLPQALMSLASMAVGYPQLVRLAEQQSYAPLGVA